MPEKSRGGLRAAQPQAVNKQQFFCARVLEKRVAVARPLGCQRRGPVFPKKLLKHFLPAKFPKRILIQPFPRTPEQLFADG